MPIGEDGGVRGPCAFRKHLRKHRTPAEELLWNFLSNKQIAFRFPPPQFLRFPRPTVSGPSLEGGVGRVNKCFVNWNLVAPFPNRVSGIRLSTLFPFSHPTFPGLSLEGGVGRVNKCFVNWNLV